MSFLVREFLGDPLIYFRLNYPRKYELIWNVEKLKSNFSNWISFFCWAYLKAYKSSGISRLIVWVCRFLFSIVYKMTASAANLTFIVPMKRAWFNIKVEKSSMCRKPRGHQAKQPSIRNHWGELKDWGGLERNALLQSVVATWEYLPSLHTPSFSREARNLNFTMTSFSLEIVATNLKF